MVEGVGVVEGVAETVALSEVAADCVGRAVGSEVVLAGSLGCGGALGGFVSVAAPLGRDDLELEAEPVGEEV